MDNFNEVENRCLICNELIESTNLARQLCGKFECINKTDSDDDNSDDNNSEDNNQNEQIRNKFNIIKEKLNEEKLNEEKLNEEKLNEEKLNEIKSLIMNNSNNSNKKPRLY